jgi:DNA-binding NtrC family response regulator
MFAKSADTVLIIENEPFVLNAIEEILTSAGMNPICAHNGIQGVTTYKEYADEIKVVILDMNLPGLQGSEVYQMIQDVNPRAKVIISTGYDEMDVLNKFDNPESVSILKKPFNAKTLLDRVQSALNA